MAIKSGEGAVAGRISRAIPTCHSIYVVAVAAASGHLLSLLSRDEKGLRGYHMFTRAASCGGHRETVTVADSRSVGSK